MSLWLFSLMSIKSCPSKNFVFILRLGLDASIVYISLHNHIIEVGIILYTGNYICGIDHATDVIIQYYTSFNDVIMQ